MLPLPLPSLLVKEPTLVFFPIFAPESFIPAKLKAGPRRGLEPILFRRPGDFVATGLHGMVDVCSVTDEEGAGEFERKDIEIFFLNPRACPPEDDARGTEGDSGVVGVR